MKYCELPTFKMLQAYKSGKLSSRDRLWVEESIRHNPMVSAVASTVGAVDAKTVAMLSKKTGEGIARKYLRVGFWSKYGVWIGLSSILLLLAVSFYFNRSTPAYTQNELALTPTFVTSTLPVLAKNSNNASSPVIEKSFSNNNKEGASLLTKKENITDQQKSEVKDEAQPAKIEVEKQPVQQYKAVTTQPQKTKKALTPIVEDKAEKESSNQENRKIILSVQQVQLLSKRFANPPSHSTKSNRNSPLRTAAKNNTDHAAKKYENLPEFPGGDQALKRYFKGKLHPVKVSFVSSEKYDRAVRVDLTIKSNGKLDDFKIFGNLSPVHKKELEEAIQAIPRFTKGSASTIYSLGISF